MEEILSKQMESILKLCYDTSNEYVVKIQEKYARFQDREERIEDLELEVASQEERASLLEQGTENLRRKTEMLKEILVREKDMSENTAQSAALAVVQPKQEEQIHLLKTRNSSLVDAVKAMQVEIKYLEEESAQMRAAKSDQAQDTEEFERNVVTTFERKMQLMKMDHDVALDFMRKEMAKSKERTKDLEV